MSTPITATRLRQLAEIVARRDPGALPLVTDLSSGQLAESSRELLRDLLTAEFVETGLAQTDEPTAWGEEVESLINMLGMA